MRRGMGASASRKGIMVAAALLTVASSFAGVKGLEMALAMMSLLMFAHGFCHQLCHAHRRPLSKGVRRDGDGLSGRSARSAACSPIPP